jgi:hypothetical protein
LKVKPSLMQALPDNTTFTRGPVTDLGHYWRAAMIRTIATTAVLLAACHGYAWADGKFESVKAYLEQTAEDEDSEVTFDAMGGTAGLTALKVVAPDGRTVIDFKAVDSKLGMRHLILESPEPKNDGKLQADFPAGVYKFTGTSSAGAALQGEAVLSHKFPSVARVLQPRPDEKNVPTMHMQVRWKAIKDATAFILVIEHEKTGRELRVDLPGNVTAFTVSDGFLAPGLEYKLAIGAVAKDGNRSFTETAFTTADKK